MKKLRKLLAFLTAVVLLGGTFGNSLVSAYADGPNYSVVPFDGSVDKTANTVTYVLQNNETAIVNFEASKFTAGTLMWDGDRDLKIAETLGNTYLERLSAAVSSITGYNPETMELWLFASDGFQCKLTYTNGTFTREGDGGIPDGSHFDIRDKNNNPGPGGDPGQGGDPNGAGPNFNASASITVNGTTTAPTGEGITGEDYELEFCVWAFAINDGGFCRFDDSLNHSSVTNGTYSDSNVAYNYDDSGFVTFKVQMRSWRVVPTSLKINNYTVPGEDLPDVSDIASKFNDQAIVFEVPNVPKADSYTIDYSCRVMTRDEYYMGNFGWWTEDGPGVAPDDLIPADEGSIELVSATVPAAYGSKTFTSADEIAAEGEPLIKWEYRDEHGEAVFPADTILKVKLVPKAGYQLVSFSMNNFPFEPGEEIGVYEFKIWGGNFHLQAEFQPASNTVAPSTEGVTGGSVSLGSSAISMGTAELKVADANLSETEKAAIDAAVPDEEYTVSEYMDIKLENVVNKFKNGELVEPWVQPLNNLSEAASISLELKDAIGEDVIVLHEKSDGTVETINATYDAATNSVSFATKSFSNYAIAYKGTASETPSGSGEPSGSETSGESEEPSEPEEPEAPEEPMTPAQVYDAETEGIADAITELTENHSAYADIIVPGNVVILGEGLSISAEMNDNGTVETIINYSTGDALPSNIMGSLKDSKDTTLRFTYEYKGEIIKVEISSEDAAEVFDPSIKWYGPEFLRGMFSPEAIAYRKAQRGEDVTAANGTGSYTVKANDTLNAIAESLGVTTAYLVSKNNIADPNVIHVGQVLVY